MPIDRNKIRRFQILNECLRNPHRLYTYDDLLRHLNRRLEDHPIALRTLKKDLADMQEEYDVKLDEELRQRRPAVLRYADLTDSIFKLSPEEADALRITIDRLLQFPEPRPLQYDYMRVCLQQIVANRALDTDREVVCFSDNLDYRNRELFCDLCQYILERQTLRLSYAPFQGEAVEEVIYPYQLRQYNDRWFLIAGVEGFPRLKNYAVDRIVKVEASGRTYVPCEVDIADYFDDVVGMTVYEAAKLEEVTLKVSATRYRYMETKPIHSSQVLVKDLSTDDYKVLRIRVRRNRELVSLLLSFGSDVEVLEPQSLRDEMAGIIQGMAAHYNRSSE